MTDLTEAEAVFWDIGGVVVALDSVQAAHREFVERLCAEHETPYSPDEAVERWRDVVGTYFAERDGTEFRPARAGYRLAVDEILDADADETAWRETFRRVVDDRAEPNADAVAAIERLADADVHQGVLSDVDHEEGTRLLELFGVAAHVDSVTTSERVGRTKPDPAMFEAALRKADVAPGRAVMVGDRYEHDVAGAARAGMLTVAYGDAVGPGDADGGDCEADTAGDEFAVDGPVPTVQVDDLRELPALLGVEE